MNALFPIIRRKRRPLLPVESLPDLPPVPPVVANKSEPVEVVVPPVRVEAVVTEPEPQANDAKAPIKRNAR